MSNGFDLSEGSILGGFVSNRRKKEDTATTWLSVDQLTPGRFQPRKFFSQEGLDKLAESFRSQGFRGTINVRPTDDAHYEIIAGERRWRAAQIAGLDKVRCIVEDYSDDEALEFALTENLQREDLSKLEETEGILRLIETKLGLAAEEAIAIIRTEGHPDKIARCDAAPNEMLSGIIEILSAFNINLQTFRSKNLRTLSLPKELKSAHLEGKISYSATMELNKVKDEEKRALLLEEAVTEALTFREVQERVQAVTAKPEKTTSKAVTAVVNEFQATAKRIKADAHLLRNTKKRERLQELLAEIGALLEE